MSPLARLHTAIACHLVLVIATLASCAVIAAGIKTAAVPRRPHPPGLTSRPADLGMIPLTVPDRAPPRRPVLTAPSLPGHTTHWSAGRRRRHAAHADTASARLATDKVITLFN